MRRQVSTGAVGLQECLDQFEGFKIEQLRSDVKAES